MLFTAETYSKSTVHKLGPSGLSGLFKQSVNYLQRVVIVFSVVFFFFFFLAKVND